MGISVFAQTTGGWFEIFLKVIKHQEMISRNNSRAKGRYANRFKFRVKVIHTLKLLLAYVSKITTLSLLSEIFSVKILLVGTLCDKRLNYVLNNVMEYFQC